MALSARKREANQRNARLAKGPHDTSLTRHNAMKHGILSGPELGKGGRTQWSSNGLATRCGKTWLPRELLKNWWWRN